MSAPGSAAASVGATTPLPSTVLISKYGKTFFDESGSGKVLMSFDSQGNGFANHPNGHPAVTTTDVGGCICDADTDIVEEWVWRKRDGPRTPFEMRVGTSYTLILRGRHDCEVICGNGARVQVGKPGGTAQGTYLDRVAERGPGGRILKLQLRGKHNQTLIDRQNASQNPDGGAKLAQVHEKCWKLPPMGMAEARVISRRSNEADLAPVRQNADWIEGIKAGGAVKKGETIWKTGNVFIETPTPAGADDELMATWRGTLRGSLPRKLS